MAGDPDLVKTIQNSSSNFSIQDDVDFFKKNNWPYVFLWTSLFLSYLFLAQKTKLS